MTNQEQYMEVIDFWFKQIKPEQRWAKDANFDNLIIKKFSLLHKMAKNNKLSNWRSTALGSLAEIIILDQFSRNMYRDLPDAFNQDALAITLAKNAISEGKDKKLPVDYKAFLYMPFMHSENKEDHEIAIMLFDQKGLEKEYQYELMHKKIIDRFERYPHRNEILKRHSTKEEIEFLQQPNSSF